MKTTSSSSISLKRLSASSAVAPLPVTTTFGHQLHHTLQQIIIKSHNANGLLHDLVDAATTTQQITLNSLSDFTTTCQPSDRKIIDDYLDFNVKLLDTCNELTEKIDTIQNYIESLKVVSHLLESGQPHPTTLARAKHLLDSLDSCHNAMETKKPFKRFFSQKLDQSSSSDSKLAEILGGSKAITSVVCEILGTALSFKSKQRLSLPPQSTRSSSWSCSLQQLQKQIKEHQKSGSSMMLTELHQTVKAAHYLRNQIKRKNTTRSDVEELKRRCEELEEGMKPFEGKVKEMYKHLISVRMALLGILSSQF